jgi:hypothetical protein
MNVPAAPISSPSPQEDSPTNNSPPPQNPSTTKSSTITSNKSLHKPPIEDFLRRAGKAGIQVKEEGWEMADKAQVMERMRREKEEREDEGWDMLEDIGEVRGWGA